MLESLVPSRYDNFKLWIQRNGCKLDPRVAIAPQNSCMGLSATSAIPQNTTIIAVPQKLIITVQKCYYGELRKLYESNDDLFDYEDSDDNQFNVLAVFIMYEKAKVIKGKREHPQEEFFSFWQPYIQSVQQAETAMDWSKQELEGLYQELIQEVDHFKKQIDRMEKRVVAFLLKRQQFADLTEAQLKKLFNYGYKLVMTRSFGYCTPGTSLIPLADLMNHGCEAVDHQLVNTKRQFLSSSERYTRHSERIDISILQEGFKSPQVTQEPVTTFIAEARGISIEQAQKMRRSERYKQILEINSQKPENMLDLNYFSSSDDEDNDTASEDEQMNQQQMQFLKEMERQEMAVFTQAPDKLSIVSYSTVETKLAEFEAKQKQLTLTKSEDPSENGQSNKIVNEITNNEQLKQIVKQTKEQLKKAAQSNQTDYSNTKLITQQTRQQSIIAQAIQKKKQGATNFQEVSQKISKKRFQDQLQNESEQSSQQQEFTWFKEPGTYFLITTHRSLKADQSIFNCYGRRTNKFLLTWYGFCYKNNLFDSVSFRFYVNFSLEKDTDKLIFEHYYGGRGLIRGFSRQGGSTIQSNEVTKEFRLKRSRICEGLTTFLRLFLMNQYRGADLKKLFVIHPASFEYEIFVLSFMEKLVLQLEKRYPEELIKDWNESSNYRIKFKAVFYEQQRNIIAQQLKMISLARQILLRLMSNSQSKVTDILRNEKDFETVRKIRKYLNAISDNLTYIRLM